MEDMLKIINELVEIQLKEHELVKAAVVNLEAGEPIPPAVRSEMVQNRNTLYFLHLRVREELGLPN